MQTSIGPAAIFGSQWTMRRMTGTQNAQQGGNQDRENTLPPMERRRPDPSTKPTIRTTADPGVTRERCGDRLTRSFIRNHFHQNPTLGEATGTVRARDCAATASPSPSTRAIKAARTIFCWSVGRKAPANRAQRRRQKPWRQAEEADAKGFQREACWISWMSMPMV